MLKTLIFIFLFFISSQAFSKETETIEMLTCSEFPPFDKRFSYPVKIRGFSSFNLKNGDTIYQFDLNIDPSFKFPRENQKEAYVPSYSVYKDVSCFSDIKPELLSYLFEDARKDESYINLYLYEDYFKKIDIIIEK
jgi:hypothetical protein